MLVGATGDWTSQIMEHGVPEIRAVYRLFEAESRMEAVVHTADHNYNQTSRESVYRFLRRHLWGEENPTPVREPAFTAEEEAFLSTWDAAHPRPATAADPAQLKDYLRGQVRRQIQSWSPTDLPRWGETRRQLTSALKAMLACTERKPGAIRAEQEPNRAAVGTGYELHNLTLLRPEGGRSTAVVRVVPAGGKAIAVSVLVAPTGSADFFRTDGSLHELPTALLREQHELLIVEPVLADEEDSIAARHSSQYYTTYNRTVLAEQVQELLDAVSYARGRQQTVNLLGRGEAGAWVLLARPFAAGVARVAAEGGWEWPEDLPGSHPMALPAVHRYGGMKAFAALAAPQPLLLWGAEGKLDTSWLTAAYRLTNAAALRLAGKALSDREIAAWLAGADRA
ncbi:MAG: hypothetical protein FJ315_09025 [SAR202 cluster bacterium]|nr:hypothetical protein [SAR202 cluster bacterium]